MSEQFTLDPKYQSRIDKMRLMIATPFYKKEAHVPYVGSLLNTVRALEFLKIKWVWAEVCGDAYVDRAKNSIIAHFLAHPDLPTDLIMIDSDLGWDLTGFLNLLLTDEEMICGVYPMKHNGKYAVQTFQEGPKPDGRGLVEVVWAPGGFVHFQRSCLEKMVDRYQHDYYTDSRAAHTGRTVNLYSCPTYEGKRFGEDVEFCRKWRAMGGKVWVHPDIEFEHVGTNVLYGCFRRETISRDLNERLDTEINRMNSAIAGYADQDY